MVVSKASVVQLVNPAIKIYKIATFGIRLAMRFMWSLQPF